MKLKIHFIVFLVFTLGPIVAADVRDVVKGAADTAPANSVIDPTGVVFGVPFGASEDEVIKAFGKPTGYIRLDSERTAMLYGQSYLLLFFAGEFDALRVGRSMIDWNVSRWIKSVAPFLEQGWQLSNGLREDMSLTEVAKLIQIEPPKTSKYRVNWSTESIHFELNFSHYTDKGEGDDAYTLTGFLMERKHGAVDHWSEPPRSKMSADYLKGKKILGFNITATRKGIRPGWVFKDSPADKAGIKAGDLIESINGQSTVDMTATQFVKLIEEKDPVILTVVPTEGERKVVTLSKVDGSTLSSGELAGPPANLLDVTVGQEAPDFEAVALDGKKLKLSELRGMPVLVNFTATWCQPCQREAPELVAAYAKFKEKGFEILSIYLDSADEDIPAHAKKLGATWPIRAVGKGWSDEIARTYGVSSIPTNILVGKDGKILATKLRGADLESAIAKAQ